ncbi:endo-1,3;1,4-beta-D-glucanase-like isoform X1 [Ziziphus jujuba]|uniref:Endo-1,31,4-beta-D-glucanase-like isoform X1 n=1 Tax=Ziziphus jujuba TaxID=326968 RepID=A0A6P4A4M0_ZIZJJ|nr:endo-1,3;1,4-beta-D-glucanase-like isoform X1 [Ziziphus jujuba]
MGKTNSYEDFSVQVFRFAIYISLLSAEETAKEKQLIVVQCLVKLKGKRMLGPNCLTNPPVSNASAGIGHVANFGGLNTYVTGSPFALLSIILISDVFGFEAPNLRTLADKSAAAGFFVAVPDFFHGDPYVSDNPYNRTIDDWLKDHDPIKGSAQAKAFIDALKEKGVSKIGAAGFCWGGKVAVELSKTDYIQASVLLHPAFTTVDDFKDVKVPISILGAEFDELTPPKAVKQYEEVLATKSDHVDYFVKVFRNVSHGWTTRYNNSDPVAVEKANEAHEYMLKWFVQHLK